MDKIKSSELFYKIFLNSQKALASEDEQAKRKFMNILSSDQSDLDKTLEFIGINNEYLRFSFAKAVILTLQEYDLVENDIDLCNVKESNKIITEAIKYLESQRS